MKPKLLNYIICVLGYCAAGLSESPSNSYRGITDPFGDPGNYEFAEDEAEDKEFFHLGRFLMVGTDGGIGIFTGGLGRSTSPGFYFGLRLLYFFDKSIAFEAAMHYSSHLDKVRPSPTQSVDIETSLLPLTGGFRYYFDTHNAPRAIAQANPYVALGAGAYFRSQSITGIQGLKFEAADAFNGHFGVNFGGGVEFLIYRRHIYLGLDLRYHWVFFDDEGDTFGGALEEGDRGGDIFSTVISLTYNF